MKERRGQSRLTSKNGSAVPVWFEFQEGMHPVKALKGQIIDSSSNGIGLRTEVPLKAGHKIVFPRRKANGALPTEGIVVWTTESPEGHQAGIMFVE